MTLSRIPRPDRPDEIDTLLPERSLLGAVLIDPNRLGEVASRVRPGDFSLLAHGFIFEALLQLRRDNRPVDAVTLASALRDTGRLEQVGGATALMELARITPSSASADEYARIVRDQSYRRLLRDAASVLVEAAKAANPHRAIEPVLRSLLEEGGSGAGGIPLTSVADLLKNDLPPREDVITGGLLPRGGMGLLLGHPKCGKTLLGLNLALATATGAQFLDWPTNRGRVLYVSGEGGPQLVKERLQKMRGTGAVPNGLFLWWPGSGGPLRLDDSVNRAGLAETLREHRIDLLVIDPLVRFHSLDENSTRDVADLVRGLATLRADSGAAVLLVHHTRKAGQNSKPGSAQEARGSSVLFGEADSAFVLSERSGRERSLHLQLRWAAEPPPLLLELDADTLQFRVTGQLGGVKRKLETDALREHLAEHGPSSLAELSQTLGCSKKTVSRRLLEAETEGWARSTVGLKGAKKWTAHLFNGE